MPIRFRCDYCGQLLSIASRKAGSTVHCPKCQHENVVPKEIPREESKRHSRDPSRFFESSRFDEWIGRFADEGTSEDDSASASTTAARRVPATLESADPPPALPRLPAQTVATPPVEPWRHEPERLPDHSLSESESSSNNEDPPPSIWPTIGWSLLAILFLLIAFGLGIIVGRYGIADHG
jgi:phage FluMu protein Com